jgi:type IV pilus assembly protein PilB
VMAQRLSRRLCECKLPASLSAEMLAASGFDVASGFDAQEPAGCARCAFSGFKGRIGLYELMAITDELRPMILEKASADELRESARLGGMRTLREDGLEKVRQGVTSVSEVLRVVGSAGR